MADDKAGRDKQAQDAAERRRERNLAADLARGDEPEPPVPADVLGDVESELDALAFPATAADVVGTVGDHVVESGDGRYTVADLVAETDAEAFESPADVGQRLQRPTVAGAMKRVAEAVDTLPNATLSRSQRDAYEKTFLALAAVDVVDDDEGIRTVADWLVERVDEKGTLPGSRDVRRQAAKLCRANGYQVRDDEWLGV